MPPRYNMKYISAAANQGAFRVIYVSQVITYGTSSVFC